MHERPTERQERSDLLKEHLHHLEELRSQQSLLQKAREGELREQDKHDAEAQRLMETDPAGHVEMMRSMQEHAAVVRELPEKLLEHELRFMRRLPVSRSRSYPRLWRNRSWPITSSVSSGRTSQ